MAVPLPFQGRLIFCNINFSCYSNSGNTAAKNKKRPGVRDVFCYDIGIIGDLSTSHRGVREVVQRMLHALFEHGFSIHAQCVRFVKPC